MLKFSEFPTYCNSSSGPHSLDCYVSVWLEMGCIRDGVDGPDALTQAETKALEDLTLP